MLDRLRERYGEPARYESDDPVGGLVHTILSQNTSDANSDRAFRELRREYLDWNAVATSDVEDLAEVIRSSGLARQKAPTIQTALREIWSRAGDYKLDFLDGMSDTDAARWLTAIPGVGPKTAACVLLFDLERDVLPVDTHVHRVSRRLGLVPSATSAEKTQALLEEQVGPEDRYATHVLFIRHGRRTCLARFPKCRECVLNDLCPSAAVFLAESASVY